MGTVGDVDWADATGTGLTMKQIRFFNWVAMAAVICMIVGIGITDAADFSMERKNATVPYAAISDGDTVYRGDTVRFTPVGGTRFNWSFGDGFDSTEEIPEHYYAYGKRTILMHDGSVKLFIGLKVDSETSPTIKSINFTTLLPPLVFQTTNITLMNESLSNNYTEALTGNRTAPPGWSGFDWVKGIDTTIEAYVKGTTTQGGGNSGLGATIFLILVFSIPFLMSWIIMKDFIVPGILGGFLGVFIIVRLPANMQPLAIAFIVMSVVAIIYSLLKET